MYLRIKSAGKGGTSGEGEGDANRFVADKSAEKRRDIRGRGRDANGYVADSADMLRIESAGKRRDIRGK